MTTNFSHMKKWPETYELLLRTEDTILEDNKKGVIDKNQMTVANAYLVLMSMCHLLMEANGVTDDQKREMVNRITDDQIKEIVNEKITITPDNKKKVSAYISLYGYIDGLKEAGYISSDSAMCLQRIREQAFLASDYVLMCQNRIKKGDNIDFQDYELIGKTPEELQNMAEEIYKDLYRETYLFANQYIPEAMARANNRMENQRKDKMQEQTSETKKQPLFGVVITVVIIVLFVLALIGLAVAVFL